MKNRYIPFGYQIQNGDSVINTEQAATVQHIFYAYTEGQSFKEIAEYLTTSGTAYHFSDNSWNKNIVARILANEIYCGAKGYPAIISKEVYSQAASIFFVTSRQRASSFGLRLFFFVLAFKLFIALPKAER